VSQNSNFTFEQPSVKSLKSAGATSPRETENSSLSHQHSMSSRFNDNTEANIQSSTELRIHEYKKDPKHQPSQAVEEYNKFFKAAIKMSGMNVKDYNRAKLNNEMSINSVRASHSTKKLAREAPRDDTYKSLKKMKARNSKDNLQSQDDPKSSQKSLKIKSAKIAKQEDLINKHLEINVPNQSLDEPKV